MKKLLLFLTLLIVGVSANAQYSPSNNLNYIKLLKTPPIGSVEDSVMVYDSSSSFVKMLPKSSIVAGYELKSNKQNDLTPDGTGTKYSTVDAVNTKVSNIDNTSDANKPVSTATQTAINAADACNVKLTGNQTISGQKSFSLTGKIDMQTDNAFPAIRVTTLGSNGGSAAVFLNDSSFPNSKALRLQTSSSGGVGNMALDVSNQSPIGTGILSNASNGGVSISSQSGDGDSYISNITYGGTGRNYVGRNNGTETYSVDKTGNVTATQYKISALNTAPASATSTGTTGEIRITSGFIYICIATNTWVRSVLTTWI